MLIDLTVPMLRAQLADFLCGAGLKCARTSGGMLVRAPHARDRREERLAITEILGAWSRRMPAAPVLLLDLT